MQQPSEQTKKKMVQFFMDHTVPLILSNEEEKEETA